MNLHERAVAAWRADPIAFTREALAVKLWHKQREILSAVMAPATRRVAVKSCHSAGKTFLAAVTALTWLLLGRDRIVITTAPTWRQVKELLWKEIRSIHAAAARRGMPLGGELPPAAPELRLDEQWMAIGFSSDRPVNVQGWHSRGGTLVILDEANGIEPAIWDALHGVLTGRRDRMLAIANPTEAAGPFFDLWKDPGAQRFSISAFDTPNVKHKIERIKGLVTWEWVQDRKARWGEHSAIYRTRVLGEFPEEGDNTLIPLAWVDAANNRWERVSAWEGAGALGLDVARYGPDSTVAAKAYANGVKEICSYPKADTMETAGWALAQLRDDDSLADVLVDADGLGAGVFDALHREIGERAVEMRGGMSASDPTRFANARAEWFWHLRERLDPAKPDAIALPRNDEAMRQLTSIRFHLTPKGLVQLESKDELRRRIGRSPDEADAIAYAMAASLMSRADREVPIVASVGYRPNPWSV